MAKPPSGGMLKTWGKELALLGYSVGIAFSFLVFGYLQEKLAKGYELPGRSERLKFPSEIVLLLLATVLNCVFSRILLSFVAPSKPPRAGAAPEGFMSRNLPFIKLSVSYILAMVCSSMAIRYISYPAQVLGKSLKPVAVILGNTVLNRTVYPLSKYLMVIGVTAGITLYSWDPSRGAGSESSTFGILLIFVSLFCDGITGSLQDAWMKEQRAQQREPHPLKAQYLTNLFSALLLLVISLGSGHLHPTIGFFSEHPAAILDVLLFSFFLCFGQFCIYAVLNSHGSLVVSIITTTRKFFSILVSVLLFNPGLLGLQQLVGVFFVFSSLGYDAVVSHKPKTE